MSAHCDLTLYKNTKFYEHQNYKIDNIEDFLTTLSADKLEFEDLQYFKVDSIDKEIKVSFNQKGIKNLHKYNYARIVIYNEDESLEWRLYYYVRRIEWLSMNTIKLHIHSDTLNTYLDDLEFHPKTFIVREHCDRWDYNGIWITTSKSEINILRNINELNEGLNPVQYVKKLNTTDISYGWGYKFEETNKRELYPIIHNSQKFPWEILSWSVEGIVNNYIIPLDDGNNPFYIMDDRFPVPIPVPHIASIGNLINNNVSNAIKRQYIPYPPIKELLNTTTYTSDNPYTPSTADNVGLTFVGQFGYTEGESSYIYYGIYYHPLVIDRADSSLNKLTNHLPNINNVFLDSTNKNFNSLFREILIVHKENPLSLLTNIVDNGFFKSNDYSNESSMYNSEFFQVEFIYGDFNYIIRLENLKLIDSSKFFSLLDDSSYDRRNWVSIYFKVGIPVSDSFSFIFKWENHFTYRYDKEDDGDLMFVLSNTKLPLFSSDYLNYMRNGYNYDIKIRDSNRAERKWGIGLKIGQTIATTGLGLATGGIGGALLGGKAIKGTFGVIGSIVSDYYQTMREDIEMEKNLAQLKSQKVGIDNCEGALDKIEAINGNSKKLCFCIKTPNKSWWKYLEDYFYYFGNKVQYYGIPQHNNRALFDYLQCKAEFVNRNSIPNKESLDDIIDRLNKGVVFIHKYLNTYTFDSDYKENVENRLLELLGE